MQKIFSWLFVLAVLWSACSREPFPPDMPEEPVFTAVFQTEAATYKLEAGVDSLYLFTDYHTENDVVLVLSGTFAKVACPAGDCPGSLTFEMRNDHEGSTVFPDTLFLAGNRDYFYTGAQTLDTIRRTTFSTPDTLDYPLFQWEIDHGVPVTGKSVTKEYTENTPHLVTLRAFRNGTLKSVSTRTVVPDTSNHNYPNVGILVSDSTQSNPFVLTAYLIDGPDVTFKWSNGDTTDQTDVTPVISNYSVRVKTNAGDTAFAQINTFDSTFSGGKTADIQLSVTNILTPVDILQLGRITIRWVDDNGVTWVSHKGLQTPDAYFQIISSEAYEPNENGRKTHKMNVAFSCRLFNNNNPSQSRPLSGTAVIAVAHP